MPDKRWTAKNADGTRFELGQLALIGVVLVLLALARRVVLASW